MHTKANRVLLVLALFPTLILQLSTVPTYAQSAPFTPTIPATGSVSVVINGFIVGVNLGNDGAGYPGPPVVSVTDPTGSNAVILAAISANGAVTNLAIKNAGSHYSAAPTLVIAPPPTNPSHTDINIIISPYVTDNIRTWTSGTNYPFGGVYTNYAGITFYLAAFPGITNGLGVIYTGSGSTTAPVTNNFPVNITNAVTVYTLMNSDTGQLGATNGTLDFYGSLGAHASFNIVQGVNIRDHYNGSYQNTVSSNLMSLYWGAARSVRLDCQGWMLPTNFFSQTLTNIQVRCFGSPPNGVPVVAAVTVRTAGPVIVASQRGSQVVCLWPSTPTNYVLQTSTALNYPAWSAVTNSLVVTNNQVVVTNQMTPSNHFFRLISVP